MELGCPCGTMDCTENDHLFWPREEESPDPVCKAKEGDGTVHLLCKREGRALWSSCKPRPKEKK